MVQDESFESIEFQGKLNYGLRFRNEDINPNKDEQVSNDTDEYSIKLRYSCSRHTNIWYVLKNYNQSVNLMRNV